MHLAAREDTWLVSSMPGRPHWILTDMEQFSQHNQLPLKGKLGRKFFNNNLNNLNKGTVFSFNNLNMKKHFFVYLFCFTDYLLHKPANFWMLWMLIIMFHRESYWEGGILPKIGQFGSTLISLYNPEVLNTVVFGVNMTHAHLRVDEVGQSTSISIFF